jgi:hypothetical protein
MRSNVAIPSSGKSKTKEFNMLKHIIQKTKYQRNKKNCGKIGNKVGPGNVLFRKLSYKLREE